MLLNFPAVKGEPMSCSHAGVQALLFLVCIKKRNEAAFPRRKILFWFIFIFSPIKIPFSYRCTAVNSCHYLHQIRKVKVIMVLVSHYTLIEIIVLKLVCYCTLNLEQVYPQNKISYFTPMFDRSGFGPSPTTWPIQLADFIIQ